MSVVVHIWPVLVKYSVSRSLFFKSSVWKPSAKSFLLQAWPIWDLPLDKSLWSRYEIDNINSNPCPWCVGARGLMHAQFWFFGSSAQSWCMIDHIYFFGVLIGWQGCPIEHKLDVSHQIRIAGSLCRWYGRETSSCNDAQGWNRTCLALSACSLPHASLNRSDILGIQVGERALLLQEDRSATVRATKSTTLVTCPLSFSLVEPSDNGMSQFAFSWGI